MIESFILEFEETPVGTCLVPLADFLAAFLGDGAIFFLVGDTLFGDVVFLDVAAAL